MDWYGPLTVLPELGFLILSTFNFLNNELVAQSEHFFNLKVDIYTGFHAELLKFGCPIQKSIIIDTNLTI